jgi:predicted transcriptional regulator
MTTISIALDDDKLRRLQATAEKSGVSVEKLIEQSIEDYLARRTAFEQTANYVLQKNAELYRRLAK